MEPARFRIRQSQQLITGRAGLVLAGQALARFAQLPQQLDPKFPVRGTALPTSDVVKSYLGLLCQAKSDFEAIEAYRGDAEHVIALYNEHGTHQQFHSEIKTDLDLERLPSGKFATNDLVLSLAALAYNVLRLIGQSALTGEDAPARRPAKRRRLRTVIQELMCVAAAIAHHARSRFLVFGAHCPALACLRRLHAQWSLAPP